MRILLNFIRHYWGTTTHKAWVFWYCFKFSAKLMWRGLWHDMSKYSPVETVSFIRIIHRLKMSTYGSKQYEETIHKDEVVRRGTNHHYAVNRHHPEHFAIESGDEPCIRSMNLLDVMEMFCDWRSAVKRHKTGDINRSIEINRKRYGLSNDITCVFKKSVNL